MQRDLLDFTQPVAVSLFLVFPGVIWISHSSWLLLGEMPIGMLAGFLVGSYWVVPLALSCVVWISLGIATGASGAAHDWHQDPLLEVGVIGVVVFVAGLALALGVRLRRNAPSIRTRTPGVWKPRAAIAFVLTCFIAGFAIGSEPWSGVFFVLGLALPATVSYRRSRSRGELAVFVPPLALLLAAAFIGGSPGFAVSVAAFPVYVFVWMFLRRRESAKKRVEADG